MNEETPLFNASICDQVAVGTCVLVNDANSILYAGPIKGCPEVTGNMLLLNTVDFEKLKAVVDRQRH